ncbi:hypothetical protein CVT26_006984 [Gymnopilus dilepis]|uniref:Uncharacterized protein n=1 Tax=Gymnopilus dilepis TaxID=231916 RepID=A0A409W171_9AGAR|nr:hypothetical protein CVT26_006984 [Gymnopilus dilepis]
MLFKSYIFPDVDPEKPFLLGSEPERTDSLSMLSVETKTYFYSKPSLIDRLPPELLQEILVLVVPFENSTHRNLALLRLTWVCPLWRAVLRQRRSLWSTLAIKIPLNLAADLALSMIHEWVGLASHRPLSFFLVQSFACRFGGKTCAFCSRIYVEIFQKYSERIHLVAGLTPHLFHNFSRSPLPNLRGLAFDYTGRKSKRPSTVLSTPLIIFAPNLQRLDIQNISINFSNVGLGPRFSSVTRLSIRRVIGLTTLLRIFVNFPNLEYAVIHYLSYPDAMTDSDISVAGIVTMPKLTNLTVFFSRPQPIDLSVFHNLDMPLLKILRIGSFQVNQFQTLPLAVEVTETIYQRLRTVRHLSLIFNNLSGPDITNFLLRFPDLETLDLQECADFEKLISEFKDIQERSLVPFLPALRKITFDISKLYDKSSASRLLESSLQFGLTEFSLDLTAFALKRLADSDQEQDLPTNALHVEFYLSGVASRFYSLLEEEMRFDAKNLSCSFVFWEEEFGARETRWQYRLEGEGAESRANGHI